MRKLIAILLLSASAFAQGIGGKAGVGGKGGFGGGAVPAPAGILLDVHSSVNKGAVTATTMSCGSITPTVGDTIIVGIQLPTTFGGWGGVSVSDNVNSGQYQTLFPFTRDDGHSFYDGVYYLQNVLAGSTTITASWTTTGTNAQMACLAFKNVRTDFAMDTSVLKFAVGPGANPTSGTSTIPYVDGEGVFGFLYDAATATAGTNYALTEQAGTWWPEYWIQTTKTSTNTPYTAASNSFINIMGALSPLPNGTCDADAVFTWEGGTNGNAVAAADLRNGTHGFAAINTTDVTNHAPGTWFITNAGTGLKYQTSTFNLATTLNCPVYAGNANETPALDMVHVGGSTMGANFPFMNVLPTVTYGYCVSTNAPSSGLLNDDGPSLRTDTLGVADYVQANFRNTGGTLQLAGEFKNGSNTPTLTLTSGNKYWVTYKFIQAGAHVIKVYDGCAANPTLLTTMTANASTAGGGPAQLINMFGANVGTDTTSTLIQYRGAKLNISGNGVEPMP